MFDNFNVSFALGLAFFVTAGLATGIRFWHGQIIRSALAIFGNWLVTVIFAETTGITDGWWFNILLDGLTAWAILYHPAGRWQAALGVSYCIQIAMHIGYGSAQIDLFGLGTIADAWGYYNALTWVAWLQLLILGGWCGGLWFGGGIRRRRGAAGAPAAGAVVRSVETPE